MYVYWIANDAGERYGNARYFTPTGVPKLYGTRARAQYLIDEAIESQSARGRVSHLRYGLAVAHVVEGELA